MTKYCFVLSGLFFHLILSAQIKVVSKFSGMAKPNSKGELEVRINKNNINSFAKYQVDLPQGVSINDIDVKGGNFSKEENKAKVVWINLPTESEFIIKLKVTFSEQVSFPVTLYQKFYYLENSIKKEVQAEPMIINATENIAIHINQELQSNDIKNTSAPAVNFTEKNNTPVTNPVKEEKKKLPETQKTDNNIPENQTYIYKIQISASPSKPDESIYSNVGKIQIIQHKGMYKVMIDKEFSSKEEALKFREEIIQKGYSGAFLVKYQNGQRVN